jgi:hypothetical protein
MKNKKDLEQIYVAHGYAAETLINGNISECVRYLNELINNGYFSTAHEELIKIKEDCAEKYPYILSKINFQPIKF